VEDSLQAVLVAFEEPATTATNPVTRPVTVPKEAKYATTAIRLDIFPAIVLNPPRARPVTAAARLDIFRGSVLSRKAALNRAECAVPVPTATNVARLATLRAIAP